MNANNGSERETKPISRLALIGSSENADIVVGAMDYCELEQITNGVKIEYVKQWLLIITIF